VSVLRRIPPLLVAFALIPTGCGTKSSSSSGLGDALSYVPKGAPLVMAVDTDPNGAQFKQIDKLIGKFPFGGQVKEQFKSAFESSSRIDYDKDVKPLLGHDLVIAVTSAEGMHSGANHSYVAAWKVNDADAAKRLVQSDASKAGSAEGTDIYRHGDGTFTAIKDDTLVAAGSQADLEAALKRPAGGDHMSEDDFNVSLEGLNQDALVRVAGDFQAILAGSPKAATARKVKWLAALRTFGATASAEDDGIAWQFRVKTEGDLTDRDLPLAAGAESAPVVRRAGEVGIGIRNPAQVITFGEAVSRVTDPRGFARFQREKKSAGRKLGIDIDRDVIGQLTGNVAVSIALNGDFAARAELRDPAAAEATLKKAVPRLKRVAKGKSIGISTPRNGKGLYAVAEANGKKVVFGVVGKTFVAATDARRAAQFAGESPSTVSGLKGSFVLVSDARALANAIAEQRGQGTAARFVTGALGDLLGSVETDTGGLTANFKLQIK
jgi:hypothetical protein